MTKQVVGVTRTAQRTAGSIINANFSELYDLNTNINTLAVGAAGSLVVPAGFAIHAILIANNTASAVTGGIKVGTTVGGTDIVAAQAVAANAILVVASASVTNRVFSKTVPQTLYFDAVTAWNGANIDLVVTVYRVW